MRLEARPSSAKFNRAVDQAVREFGIFAEGYVPAFDRKWLRGAKASDAELIGLPDIQSMADLANSYDVVRSMRLLLVTRDAILQLGVALLRWNIRIH